jgi:glycerol-3-phosphate O-acyltransferase
MATEAGVCQAVFPEGGLSIDGKLRTPKLGLFDYMLKSFNPAAERDLVFIPVGINYDRVLEDRSQLRKLDRTAPPRSVGFALAVSAAFNAKNLWLAMTGRWYRFGYACVNFGSPLSMREYLRETGENLAQLPDAERHAAVSRVGEILMRRIGDVIPALPVAVVASVMERSAAEDGGCGLSELELKSRALELMKALEHRGARVYIPRQDQDYAIGVGLRMLTLRRLVIEQDGLFTPAPENRPVLAYYANSICHLVDDTAGSAEELVLGGKADAQITTPATAAGRA